MFICTHSAAGNLCCQIPWQTPFLAKIIIYIIAWLFGANIIPRFLGKSLHLMGQKIIIYITACCCGEMSIA